MPKKPVKKAVKFAQKVAPKLKKPQASVAPKAPKAIRKPPAVKPPQPPAPPPPPPVVPTRSEADKIWDEIRNLPIQMFGLPGQVVAQHAVPFPIEPSKLYLTIRSSATLPSLEVAVGDKFTVEQADRFVIVARRADSLFSQFKK